MCVCRRVYVCVRRRGLTLKSHPAARDAWESWRLRIYWTRFRESQLSPSHLGAHTHTYAHTHTHTRTPLGYRADIVNTDQVESLRKDDAHTHTDYLDMKHWCCAVTHVNASFVLHTLPRTPSGCRAAITDTDQRRSRTNLHLRRPIKCSVLLPPVLFVSSCLLLCSPLKALELMTFTFTLGSYVKRKAKQIPKERSQKHNWLCSSWQHIHQLV